MFCQFFLLHVFLVCWLHASQHRLHSNWSFSITKIPLLVYYFKQHIFFILSPLLSSLEFLLIRAIFSEHIELICQEAGRSINVLLRLSRHLASENKVVLFKSFRLSHVRYCQVIWHFYSRTDKKKINKVQFRTLRVIFNDFISLHCTVNYELRLTDRFLNREKDTCWHRQVSRTARAQPARPWFSLHSTEWPISIIKKTIRTSAAARGWWLLHTGFLLYPGRIN